MGVATTKSPAKTVSLWRERRKQKKRDEKTSICPYCDKEFVKIRPHQIVCGGKRCLEKHARAYRRSLNESKYHTQVCEVCGCQYETSRDDRRTCGAQECQLKLRNGALTLYSKNGPPYQLVCEFCGVTYTTNKPYQRTCGAETCRQMLARHYIDRQATRRKTKARPRPVKKCPYCGIEFEPIRITQITCGGDECRRRYSVDAAAIRQRQLKNGERTVDESRRLDKKVGMHIDYYAHLPQRVRVCLKCGKKFTTDVNWICDPCHEINAEIYMP